MPEAQSKSGLVAGTSTNTLNDRLKPEAVFAG
jgi:hypothetical protein